jgi:hypothetical protein
MSRSYDVAEIKARTSPGYSDNWASATEHQRDSWPAPDRRCKCHCGCKGTATHVGGANGMGLTSGCELSIRRWVRDGYAPPKPFVDARTVACPMCGAEAGRQCRAASGQRSKHSHAARWEAVR